MHFDNHRTVVEDRVLDVLSCRWLLLRGIAEILQVIDFLIRIGIREAHYREWCVVMLACWGGRMGRILLLVWILRVKSHAIQYPGGGAIATTVDQILLGRSEDDLQATPRRRP